MDEPRSVGLNIPHPSDGWVTNTLRTSPYGLFCACDEFESDGLGVYPFRLLNKFGGANAIASGSWSRVSHNNPDPAIFVPGVRGNGVALRASATPIPDDDIPPNYSNGLDTAFIAGVTPRGDTITSGWGITGFMQMLSAEVPEDFSHGGIIPSGLSIRFGPLGTIVVKYAIRYPIPNDNSGGTPYVTVNLFSGQGPWGGPTEYYYVQPDVAAWNFIAIDVTPAGQITGSIGGAAFAFATLMPLRTNEGLFSQISSGANIDGYTIAFDELGFWPRRLTAGEFTDLSFAPGWPNLPHFPR